MSLALKYKSFQRIYVFPLRNHVPDSTRLLQPRVYGGWDVCLGVPKSLQMVPKWFVIQFVTPISPPWQWLTHSHPFVLAMLLAHLSYFSCLGHRRFCQLLISLPGYLSLCWPEIKRRAGLLKQGKKTKWTNSSPKKGPSPKGNLINHFFQGTVRQFSRGVDSVDFGKSLNLEENGDQNCTSFPKKDGEIRKCPH